MDGCTVVFVNTLFLIVYVSTIAIGWHSLVWGLNTGTQGIMTAFWQDTLDSCKANVSFLATGHQNVSGGPIIVPCLTGGPDLGIDICYNRADPNEFAYDYRNLHDHDKNYFNFCDETGYGGALALLIIGIVAASISILFNSSLLASYLYSKCRKRNIEKRNFVEMP